MSTDPVRAAAERVVANHDNRGEVPSGGWLSYYEAVDILRAALAAEQEPKRVEITDEMRRAARESVLAPLTRFRDLAFRVICDYEAALSSEAQEDQP